MGDGKRVTGQLGQGNSYPWVMIVLPPRPLWESVPRGFLVTPISGGLQDLDIIHVIKAYLFSWRLQNSDILIDDGEFVMHHFNSKHPKNVDKMSALLSRPSQTELPGEAEPKGPWGKLSVQAPKSLGIRPTWPFLFGNYDNILFRIDVSKAGNLWLSREDNEKQHLGHLIQMLPSCSFLSWFQCDLPQYYVTSVSTITSNYFPEPCWEMTAL